LGREFAAVSEPGENSFVRYALALAAILIPTHGYAGRYVVARGETLEHVARHHGCSTEALLQANRLDTTIVPIGTVVVIPRCGTTAKPRSDDDRARRALAVIDGTKAIERAERREPRSDGASRSVGKPWDGRLENGRPMPRGEGYVLRRPAKAYGAEHVVAHLRAVIGEVRALHPHVHTLAIGDLSDRDGGPLDRHRSHQSGLDVDVGLYFTKAPADYPAQFVAANADLDLPAMWALITAFSRTTNVPNGVEIILLDTAIQARLYKWARARGTPEDQLAELLQYPRDPGSTTGFVRHWPNHADHLHVRFREVGH
jgi:murein endopeptidase